MNKIWEFPKDVNVRPDDTVIAANMKFETVITGIVIGINSDEITLLITKKISRKDIVVSIPFQEAVGYSSF